MSCPQVPIQTILGSECIGDSLPKIVDNFENLGNAACDLYTKVNSLSTDALKLSVVDSPTIDLSYNSSTGVLSANVIGSSLTTSISSSLSASPMVAKAWVNFNGTTSPGTIRSQFNVSSVTKNGTGDYTINFATALADANYSYSFGLAQEMYVGGLAIKTGFAPTASSIRLQYGNTSSLADNSNLSVQILGN
jgi:hypothetical protein